MSSEDVKKFHEMVAGDPALQSTLQSTGSVESFKKTAVEIGREKGLSFSEDEVQSHIESNMTGELSEDDLKSVAGGSGDCGVKKWTYSFPGCSVGGN
jgi:predicted ribosomally synthesized peptide with nif11-like leader